MIFFILYIQCEMSQGLNNFPFTVQQNALEIKAILCSYIPGNAIAKPGISSRPARAIFYLNIGFYPLCCTKISS